MATEGYVDTVTLHNRVGGVEGKRLTDWRRRADIKAFLSALSRELNVPIDGKYETGSLVEYERGYRVYLHPSVAARYSEYLTASKHEPLVVYVIHAEGTDYYKVGIANDIQDRISRMQGSCPHGLTLVKTIACRNAAAKEKEMHSRLNQYRVRGEWFKLQPDQVQAL